MIAYKKWGGVPDNYVDLIVTDPPYNISKVNNSRLWGEVELILVSGIITLI